MLLSGEHRGWCGAGLASIATRKGAGVVRLILPKEALSVVQKFMSFRSRKKACAHIAVGGNASPYLYYLAPYRQQASNEI